MVGTYTAVYSCLLVLDPSMHTSSIHNAYRRYGICNGSESSKPIPSKRELTTHLLLSYQPSSLHNLRAHSAANLARPQTSLPYNLL